MATDPKKLHYDLVNVGLRAQATATGFLQLCKELRSAGVLDDDAVDRVKSAIAEELTLNAPRSANLVDYRREVRERLDRLFAGQQGVGNASELNIPSDDQRRSE